MKWILVAALAVGCDGSVSGGSDAVGGGGGDGKGSGAADAPANQTAQQFCVTETNRYRTTVPSPGTGAPRAAVAESSALEQYATTGAMIDQGQMMPHYHFMSTNGGGVSMAENECPGWLGWHLSPGQTMTDLVKQCLALFYSEGPGGGHYENMMNSSYTKGGCGFYQDTSSGQVTITQDFAF